MNSMLFQACYQFLLIFCFRNSRNQLVLAGHLQFFLRQREEYPEVCLLFVVLGMFLLVFFVGVLLLFFGFGFFCLVFWFWFGLFG